jgi:hypothetical protein
MDYEGDIWFWSIINQAGQQDNNQNDRMQPLATLPQLITLPR